MSENPSDAARPTAVVARSTLRRAPRFGRFIVAGVLLGALLAAVAALLGPENAVLGRVAVFILVFLALGTAGAMIAAVIAIVADRRSARGLPARSDERLRRP